MFGKVNVFKTKKCSKRQASPFTSITPSIYMVFALIQQLECLNI